MRENWDRLIHLGWGGDLLPCVQPWLKISPNSDIQKLGKVPSTLNGAGYAVGIPGWTKITANTEMLSSWAANPNYGICIQTRRIRAIDIDIPDPMASYHVQTEIYRLLGLPDGYPCRYRDGTGKVLIPIDVAGCLRKYTVRIEDVGVIEFLADGCQFVAFGQHPEGGDYKWVGVDGLDNLITLTEDVYIAFMDDIARLFGNLETQKFYKRITQVDIADVSGGTDDPIVALLLARGDVLNEDGLKLYIKCPWRSNHAEDDLTTTVYMADGHNRQPGGFKCLRAGCEHRTTYDFLDAIGYTTNDDGLPVMPDVIVNSAVTATNSIKVGVFNGYMKIDKNGRFKNDMVTVLNWLNSQDSVVSVKLDTFTDQTLVSIGENDKMHPLTDVDVTDIRALLQNKYLFDSVSASNCRDALLSCAKKNAYDSAIDWLSSLKWDGVERVKYFCTQFMSCDPGRYSELLSRYLFTALAARVMQPGCMARIVPIFVSEQEQGKTSALRALSPHKDMYCSVSLSISDADLARSLRGVLIAEWEEVRGMTARDSGALKAFISKQTDKWVPKYNEFTTSYERRFVMIGSSNPGRFLDDPTGYTRFAPITVRSPANWKGISDVRDQMWAESRVLMESIGGIDYSPLKSYLIEHQEVYDDYVVNDIWETRIIKALSENPNATNDEIATQSLSKGIDTCTNRDALRIENIRTKLGAKKG